jgi:beta-lactamase regulating signal transducer with metallopeptidase domain
MNMEQLFTRVLNMSVTGSYIILTVLAVRLLLKRAPKKYSYALWGVAAFRLVCPFSFSSIISIFNLKPFDMTAAQRQSEAALTYVPSDSGANIRERITSGIPAMNSVIRESIPNAVPTASADPVQIWIAIGALLWCIGAAALLIYAAVSFIKLRRKTAAAVRLENNVYGVDWAVSPFVLGLFRPKIYIPFSLRENERPYILRHETVHLKRKDHIVKLFAFLILAVHWFNPLVWLAFIMMGRDMEMSCDERVLADTGTFAADYGTSLLSFAAVRPRAVLPPAFGEIGVKERIRNILKFKKPGVLLTVAAVILCLAAAAVCAANPIAAKSTIQNVQLTDREKTAEGVLEDSSIFKLEFGRKIKGIELYAEEWHEGKKISSRCISSGTAMDQNLNITSGIPVDTEPTWSSSWNVTVEKYEGSQVNFDWEHNLPQNVDVVGCVTSAYGASSGNTVEIEPGKEYILMAIVFIPPGESLEPAGCEEFTENPEKLAECEYVSLIRCKFLSEEPKPEGDAALYGNYEFKEQLYMNPLSSFIALGDYKEYYTFSEDMLTITSFDGRQEFIPITYEQVPVNEDEFKGNFAFGALDSAPIDISKYKERVQINLNGSDTTRHMIRLYLMDDEIWLARVPNLPKSETVPMFWSIYRIEPFNGELPAPQAEAEPILQVSITGTKDGTQEFSALQGKFESGYENDACYNITTSTVSENSDYRVFKYDTSCASFLLYEDEVYPLGEWFGGFGVTSMEIWDSNGDGIDELYYTYSWGSGIHRSHAAFFDPAAKKTTAFDYVRMDGDMVFAPGSGGLSLYAATPETMESFTKFRMGVHEYLGSVEYKDGQIVLSPVLDEK